MSQANLTYKEFFKLALDKFGVDSPAELDDEEKAEFFDYIDRNWTAKDESFVKGLIESEQSTENILLNIIESSDRKFIVIWFAKKIRETNRLNDIENAAQELASSLGKKGHSWSTQIEKYNWKRFVSDIKNYLKQQGQI